MALRTSRLELLDLSYNIISNVELLFSQRLIDDGDPDYREEGPGFEGNLNQVETAFEGDYRYRFADEGDDIFGAFWTFEGLRAGQHAGRAGRARTRIRTSLRARS